MQPFILRKKNESSCKVLQMKTVSPIQWHNVGKLFFLFLILLSVAWSTVSFISFGDIYIGWPIVFINLSLSIALAWHFYKNRYHTVFSYNEEEFELQKGKSKIRKRWKDFAHVSLVHQGHGYFSVRLYKSETWGSDFVDIPATDLKLDASDLRFEVMKFVQ